MSGVECSSICPASCPGCPSDRAQGSVAHKLDWLRRRLSPWCDCLQAVRASSLERGYRDRVCLHARWIPDDFGGHWGVGLLRRDELVEIPHCPIHSVRVRDFLEKLLKKLPNDPSLGLVYVSIAGPLVTLVLKRNEVSSDELEALRLLGSALGSDVGLFLNLHPAAGHRVFGRKWVHLCGPKIGWQDFSQSLGFSVCYGPSSFQQAQPELYAEALCEARNFLFPVSGRVGGSAVLDLCSGVGVTLRLWREAGAATVGVELGSEAVRLAALNAGADLILQGRASDRIPQLEAWRVRRAEEGRVILAFVNPPRLGLEPEVLDWLARSARPVKIAYLSCSAGTLARDLSSFISAGYCVHRIIPYDFFAGTRHVETLVFLSRD